MQYLIYQNNNTHLIECVPVQDEKTTNSITHFKAASLFVEPVEADSVEKALDLMQKNGFINRLSQNLSKQEKIIIEEENFAIRRKKGREYTYKHLKENNQLNQSSLAQYKMK